MLLPPVYELSITFPNLENKNTTKKHSFPKSHVFLHFCLISLLSLTVTFIQSIIYALCLLLTLTNPDYYPIIPLKSLLACQYLSNIRLYGSLPHFDRLAFVDFQNICFSCVICWSLLIFLAVSASSFRVEFSPRSSSLFTLATADGFKYHLSFMARSQVFTFCYYFSLEIV